MARKAFEAIEASLEEAIAYNKGRAAGARVRTYPAGPLDIVAIRHKVGLSQAEFCAAFGFSKATLTKWEQGQRRPTGPARALLKIIDHDPKAALKALAA